MNDLQRYTPHCPCGRKPYMTPSEHGDSVNAAVALNRIRELEAERDRLAAIVRHIVMDDSGHYVLSELGACRLEAAKAAAASAEGGE